MKKYAVIVAGGSGSRMGSAVPKQFLSLHGKPVLAHTIDAFFSAFDDITIILVLPAAHMREGQKLVDAAQRPAAVQLREGGDTRYASVKNGLACVSKDAIVLVHDGVRCLVTPALIRKCYEAAALHGNAVPAVAAIDSVRLETGNGNRVLDRSSVRLIQTPQTFRAAELIAAFDQPYEEGFTDEASVLEKTGGNIHLVEGEITNIKITTPLDLLIGEKLLEERARKMKTD